jgi:thiosulfate/3-mercaptopyruvate sulfurtransferase
MTFVNPQYLVETDWLAEHLDDPHLRVIDCTMYLPDYFEKVEITTASGRANYEQAHIPGAAHVDLLAELTDHAKSGFYAAMPPAEQFSSVMSRIGVGDGTRVVLYDDFLGMFATRVWWMLRAFGFDNAAILNGGWLKWRDEGRPISTDPATYPPSTFVAVPRPELIADRDDVLAAIGDDSTCLLNALLEQEYTGDPAFPHHYGRPGHIPTSVNVPFINVIDMQASNQYADPSILRGLYEGSGALASDRVITYCGGGIAASQAAYLLTLLGVENVALYDGSLTEWAADPSLPLVVTAMDGGAA